MRHRQRDIGTGRGRAHALFPRLPLLALVATLPLAGCDLNRVLEVTDPEVATPGSLRTKDALPAVRAGALGDFAVAYDGSNFGNPVNIGSVGQINFSGLLADEFLSTETFDTRIDIDSRQIALDNGDVDNDTRTLHRARASAEFGVARFAEFDPNTAGHAEVLNLAGFTYVLFAENYCSGVPTSALTDAGDIEYGQQETTDQILDRALAHFDGALAAATAAASVPQQNVARVGRGRALLAKGDFAGASAAVTAVPITFQYLMDHSANTNRQNNGVWAFSINQERWGIANLEGGTGLNFRIPADPRVTFTSGGPGFDGANEVFYPGKYNARESDVVIASGIEARLIEAEALAQANNAGYLAILNNLRATQITPALPALADPGAANARVDQLFRERAFWLFLTSHRLGDLRRLIREYGRGSEAVFPTGVYHKGGTYGPDVNLPLTIGEDSNPNFQGCLSRDA